MKSSAWVVVPIVMLLSGCNFDGGPIITGETDHKINVGGELEDAQPLSLQVRQALRKNPQTSLIQIQISTPSEDTVKLSGSVDNDGIRQEAERIAGQVPGVRFVVNTLNIRR